MRMKLRLALSVLAALLFTGMAQADSVFSVSTPNTPFSVSAGTGDSASISFDWDATTDTISDLALVIDTTSDSTFQIASVGTSFSDGSLDSLNIISTEGSSFQFTTADFGPATPPIPPIPGTYFFGIFLQWCTVDSPNPCPFSQQDFQETAGTFATVAPVGTPEPSLLLMLLSTLGLLLLAKRFAYSTT
jgi:hypothetical protein